MNKEKMININASLLEEHVFNSFKKDDEEVKVANFYLKNIEVFLILILKI